MTSTNGHMREVYPIGGEAFRYRISELDGLFTLEAEGEEPAGSGAGISISIESRQTGEGLCRTHSGRTHHFAWAWVGQELHLWLDGQLFVYERAATLRRGVSPKGEAYGEILAPMPGAVLEVLVSEGERVEQGQTILLLESMKMELAISASLSGVVRRISVRTGQQVERGMRLVELEGEE